MRYPSARMSSPLRSFCLASALGFALVLGAAPALAQGATPPAGKAPVQTADQARAAEHFQRAKDLYQAGSYRDAISELEAARALDPKAKELVFNLGIVHEKLARFDEAIAFFQSYMGMDGITPAERAKAESVITRIDGAKREAETSKPETAPVPPERVPTVERQIGDSQRRGRVDALTIGAAAISAAALGAGTVFGIRALTTRPDDFVTGRDGSYRDLRDQTDSARTSAIIADVGIAVGIVAGLAAAYLYFGRTKDVPRAIAGTAPGGATFRVLGTF